MGTVNPQGEPRLYIPLTEPSQPPCGTEPIIITLLWDDYWSQGGPGCVTSRLTRPIYLTFQTEKLRPTEGMRRPRQAEGLMWPPLPLTPQGNPGRGGAKSFLGGELEFGAGAHEAALKGGVRIEAPWTQCPPTLILTILIYKMGHFPALLGACADIMKYYRKPPSARVQTSLGKPGAGSLPEPMFSHWKWLGA